MQSFYNNNNLFTSATWLIWTDTTSGARWL